MADELVADEELMADDELSGAYGDGLIEVLLAGLALDEAGSAAEDAAGVLTMG
jgi:hypothetical protein